MRKILVTGAAGFVGRHIVRKLLEAGDEVHAVDNISPYTGAIDPSNNWPIFDPRQYRKFLFYREDCRDWFGRVTDTDFDYAFHLAAMVGGRLMIENNPLAVADDLPIDVANSLGNVFPHNVWLSDFAGLVEIPIRDYAKGAAPARLSIDPEVRRSQALAGSPIAAAYQLDRFAATAITTLDSFGLADVRLIKLDVEGVELNVLHGARETIAASGYPPILFASWADQILPLRESARADLLAGLDGLGYELTAFGTVGLAQHRDSRKIEITLLI